MYQKDSTRRQNIITGNSHHHPPKIFFGARVEASVATKNNAELLSEILARQTGRHQLL
jgi:hypothetical protein